MSFFIPLISKEKMASLMAENAKIRSHIINNSIVFPEFMSVCEEILKAETDKKTSTEIRKKLQQNPSLARACAAKSTSSKNLEAQQPYFTEASEENFEKVLKELRLQFSKKTNEITPIFLQLAYEKIEENIASDMKAKTALETLEMLNIIVSKMWASSLTSDPFKNLPGIFNHCIKEIYRNTGYNWNNILTKHGGQFSNLLSSLEIAGLTQKLFQPN
jgi:hypothetical protein